jgi:hypothetical protein
MATQRQLPSDSFAATYPNLAWFIEKQGWLELGVETASGYCESFVRALDAGGMIWEGKFSYASIDEALQDAERGVAAFRRENRL